MKNFATRVHISLSAVLLLAGCGSDKAPLRPEYQVGEKVQLGPLTYTVLDSAWRSQLGDAGRPRYPEHRFLLVAVSIQNTGSSEATVPPFVVMSSSNQEVKESQGGEGVERWLGLIRNVGPKQTAEGYVLFDAPLGTYRLKLAESSDSGEERHTFVTIPARIDVEAPLTPPIAPPAAPTPAPGRPVK